MESIKKIGGILFVLDDEESKPLISIFRAEHSLNRYKIVVDTTTMSPYYELFRTYKENGRQLQDRLFASSNIERLSTWIKDNVN